MEAYSEDGRAMIESNWPSNDRDEAESEEYSLHFLRCYYLSAVEFMLKRIHLGKISMTTELKCLVTR
jgi:hypothetical protein